MPVIDPIDEFGDPDRDPLSRRLTLAAHSLPYVLMFYSTYCVLRWLGVLDYSIWVGVPFLLCVIIASLHINLARLCLKCMQQVPEDAPVRVHRWRRLLWLWHQNQGRRAGLMFILILVLTWLRFPVSDMLGLPWQSTPWLNAPGDILVLLLVWSEWKHHRYQPWCPYCKWGGGDDGMHEPSPDPHTLGTKVA